MMSSSGAPDVVRVLGLFLKHPTMLAPPGSAFVRGSLPYRAELLEDATTRLLAIGHARRPAHVKIRDVIEHRSGLNVDTQIRSLRAVASSHVVLSVLEPEAEFPALLRRWRVAPYARRPLVVLSCWWAEELLTGTPERRRRIVAALRHVDRLIVLSENQREIFARHGVAERTIVPVRFGVDPDYYSPEPSRAKRFQVLAAGVDRGRDFATLVAAAERLPHRRFDIFTSPQRRPLGEIPANVTLHDPVPLQEHRDNLRDSELVVVPTHDLAYPSGQSVLLEASSAGICTAVTQTPAMAEYIQDGVTTFALPLHDPAGVATVIDAVLGDAASMARVAAAGRARAHAELNLARMWAGIRDVVHDVARS